MTGRARSGSAPGENRVQRLDQHDLAAERGVDRAQFHADVTAADDQQVFRNVLDLQRLARGHDARIAEIKRLRHRGFGADGDDRLLVVDELLALLRLDAQGLGILEITAPVNDLHAAHFGQLRNAAGKSVENGIFPRPQFGRVNLRACQR